MDNPLCIIIPVYKKALNLRSRKALAHNMKKIGKTPCFFVAPKDLEARFYHVNFPGIPVMRFPNKYFQSTETYNKLMLSPFFYKQFTRYQYICICQTDVLILGDMEFLLEMTKEGYDYWGAPWYPSHRISLYRFRSKQMRLLWENFAKQYVITVGNGGLSMRHVKNTIRLLHHHPIRRRIWNQNEDYFFALIGRYFESQFHIAPSSIAKKFALETNMKEIIQKDGRAPFGVHAWEKHYPELLEEVTTY